MEKPTAQSIAIDVAKVALGACSGTPTTYPSAESADDVADFIETLTNRLIAM